jgi:hypothetical protein
MCTRNKLNRIYNNEEDAAALVLSLRSQNTSAFILRRCQPINSRAIDRSSALFSGRARHLRNDETRRRNGKSYVPAGKTAGALGSPKKGAFELCTQWESGEPLLLCAAECFTSGK